MAVSAIRQSFTGATTPISSYDSTKINLGSLLVQNTGASNSDKWCGPIPVSVARPAEQTVAMPGFMPRVVSWSSTLDWIFLADVATAAATRRFQMWTLNKAQTGSGQTNAFTPVGSITVTFPVATAITIRGFAVTYNTYTTGTVAVSGTAVTGTGTAWSTARFAVGSRIGFGTTDPTQVTTWYNVSAIGSDTSITLASTAGTIASGTAFVIEEIRLVIGTTNATATNGGLFVVKGLNPSDFTGTGTAIPSATTVDNIKACYWLADASTVTNTVLGGITIDNSTATNTSHMCYALNGTTTAQIYQYNLRAALTLTAGKDTSNFVLSTGVSATLTGTIQQYDSLCTGLASHGPGSGVNCMYYTTSTRVYRVPYTSVTSGSTTFNADLMAEIPTGGVATIAATSSMRMITYMPVIDRFIITTNAAQMYCTQYNPSTAGFDHTFQANDFQVHATTADTGAPWHPSITGSVCSVGQSNGMLYISRDTAVTGTNQTYNLPIGAHWTYGSGNYARLITPAINTSTATKYYNVYTNLAENIGGNELGVSPEPLRMLYRTSGISDNSGSWIALDSTGDLSGVTAASSIQFAFEFKIMGKQCTPARVYNMTVVYESSANIPGQFEWSVNDSDVTNGTVGFNQIATYGHTPAFTINYYREDTSANVLTDTSSTNASGQFQYWTGSAWANGVGSDSVNQRRRYVPSTGLPSNVNLYTTLSVS